ncbi:hypothetical protein OGAPHI_000493 [Ogataea philodendri]|uniref:Uncharacterized protein n=1 Tax=Ogataea philodendri TaxID=1378263 RepID=A0A9P8TAE8_9ASCO|nr:uncharacterized protein OGAPHI_000493 [Ogataea philodendri]KAH3671270.1 hypothetical protein OGAPHI_000493 [Ogataea philodendri]
MPAISKRAFPSSQFMELSFFRASASLFSHSQSFFCSASSFSDPHPQTSRLVISKLCSNSGTVDENTDPVRYVPGMARCRKLAISIPASMVSDTSPGLICRGDSCAIKQCSSPKHSPLLILHGRSMYTINTHWSLSGAGNFGESAWDAWKRGYSDMKAVYFLFWGAGSDDGWIWMVLPDTRRIVGAFHLNTLDSMDRMLNPDSAPTNSLRSRWYTRSGGRMVASSASMEWVRIRDSEKSRRRRATGVVYKSESRIWWSGSSKWGMEPFARDVPIIRSKALNGIFLFWSSDSNCSDNGNVGFKDKLTGETKSRKAMKRRNFGADSWYLETPSPSNDCTCGIRIHCSLSLEYTTSIGSSTGCDFSDFSLGSSSWAPKLNAR